MELFSFPFLFPGFCHSIIYRAVSIVSDGRNQFSFVFFYVVFESLPVVIGALGTVIKRMVQEGLVNKKTRGDHPSSSIIKIGLITEKNPGD